MTTQQIVKRIRGTTVQNGVVALPEGCFVVKTPIDGTVWVHDGTTNGGFPIGAGSIPLPVSVPNGGTGLATAPANGQLLIGNGTNYTLNTLTAGANITITNAAGSVTIAASATFVNDSVTTGITAAGTNQAGATALTTQQNYVSTGINNVAGVVPATGLMVAGNHIYVANENATNTLIFYPPVGATINNQAANAPINIGANTTALFVVKSTTALRSVP